MAIKYGKYEPIHIEKTHFSGKYIPPHGELNFSNLVLEFHTPISTTNIKTVLKDLTLEYLKLFKLPIMAVTAKVTKNTNGLYEEGEYIYLYGWVDLKSDEILLTDNSDDFSEFIKSYSMPKLSSSYFGTKYLSAEQRNEIVNKKMNKNALKVKVIKFFFLFFEVLLPISMSLASLLSKLPKWFEWGSFAYVTLVIIFQHLKRSNIIKKSDNEIEKESIETRDKQYIYWCNRNPEGFERLKIEAMQLQESQEIKSRVSNSIKEKREF